MLYLATIYNIKITPEVFDFDNLEKGGQKIDGMLGSNFLKLFTVRIDYAKQMMTFSANTDPFQAELTRSHKIGLYQGPIGLISASFKVSGNKTLFQAGIDTGSGSSLLIPCSLMEDMKPGLDCPVVRSKGIVVRGVFGESDGTLSRMSWFKVGEYRVQNFLVLFIENKLNSLFGNAFLSQFTVVIDYSESTLYLFPREKQTFETNRCCYGFDVEQNFNKKTAVYMIWEGSPADRVGLRVGDSILRAVADRETGTYYEEIVKLMANHDTIHLFVQRDGGETEMVLKKEFLLPEIEKP